MEPLLEAALLGTSRRLPPARTGTPVDAIATHLDEGAPERALLLRAGAVAIACEAGYRPAMRRPPPPAAPPETLPACSPAATALVAALLQQGEWSVCAEACERMRRAGLRLPFPLLPAALRAATANAMLRSAVASVLGTRGCWLAEQNPAWTWVKDALIEIGDELPAEMETHWQEGTLTQRQAVLRRMRAADPARARQWIADEWAREKPDTRLKWIDLIAERPEPEDEPLLESALDDRSVLVRQAAADALARLPGSGLAARAIARADALLGWVLGQLLVRVPTGFALAWEHDGIQHLPRSGTSQQGWWLVQLLSRVPLSHWQMRFARPPAQIVAAAATGEYSAEVIEGWTRAATLFGGGAWTPPLWDWWNQQVQVSTVQRNLPRNPMLALVRAELVKRLKPEDALVLAARMIAGDQAPHGLSWPEIAPALPRPWPAAFGESYLRGLRDFVSNLLAPQTINTPPWLQSLSDAALSLPPECFASALAPWPFSAAMEWPIQQFSTRHDQLLATIRQRQRLYEEIPTR